MASLGLGRRWSGRGDYARGVLSGLWAGASAPPAPERVPHEQLLRLNALVVSARNGSRFYRELFRDVPLPLRSIEELPVVDKAKLMRGFDDWSADPSINRAALNDYFRLPFRFDRRFLNRYLAFHTSGSSGRGAYTVWSERDFGASVGLLLASQLGSARAGAGSARARVGAAAAYIGVVDDYVGGNSWAHALRWFSNLRILSMFEPAECLVRTLNEHQPRVLASKPHVIASLANEQLAGRLRLRELRRITVAGENLTEDTADAIRSAFGLTPINSYSACETGPIARQRSERRQLDVYTQAVVVELLDERGASIREYHRPGRVVVTNLYRRAMPIIRYDLGDVAVFLPGPVPFGHLGFIEGRATSVLDFDEGGRRHRVWEYPLWSIHVPGLRRYQLVQTAGMSLEVRLEWSPERTDFAAGQRMFQDRLDRILGHHDWWFRVQVSYRRVPRIAEDRSGKAPVVVRASKADDHAATTI